MTMITGQVMLNGRAVPHKGMVAGSIPALSPTFLTNKSINNATTNPVH